PAGAEEILIADLREAAPALVGRIAYAEVEAPRLALAHSHLDVRIRDGGWVERFDVDAVEDAEVRELAATPGQEVGIEQVAGLEGQASEDDAVLREQRAAHQHAADPRLGTLHDPVGHVH